MDNRKPLWTVHGTMRAIATTYNGKAFFGPRPRILRRLYTGIDCKTERHALAQYRRLKVADRQVDATPKRGPKYVAHPRSNAS